MYLQRVVVVRGGEGGAAPEEGALNPPGMDLTAMMSLVSLVLMVGVQVSSYRAEQNWILGVLAGLSLNVEKVEKVETVELAMDVRRRLCQPAASQTGRLWAG